MEELLKMLDEEFEYIEHEIIGDTIYVKVESKRVSARCPYCGELSDRVHSRYKRSFGDLPIQGKKVEIVIDNRKMLCGNKECPYKTFAETFACLPFKGKRSTRLTDEIVRISMEMSSVSAAAMMQKGIAKIGKSTICNLLKKSGAKN